MRRFLLPLVLFFVTFISCDVDNDSTQNFYLEVLPINSVDVPDTFIFGQTYEIGITYNRPAACYLFNDFIYEINENERTVGIVNTVYPDTNCEEVNEDTTVYFDFTPFSTEPYLFKFYQGEDEQGIDQYLLVEIPVIVE